MTSQWGNPAETLSHAVSVLSQRIGSQAECSRFFATPAFPAGSGPDFVNATAALEAKIDPAEVLEICHSVESLARRTRDQRWGPRTLDVDFLGYGDLVLPTIETQSAWRTLPLDEQMSQVPDQLILPHPRLQDRAFVLVPLQEVAPDWIHPVLGLSVSEMLARLPAADRTAIKPLRGP